MYGAIGGSIWGEQSDDFQSNLFYDDTLKDLKKVASEHYPALRRIRERERDAEQLYLSNPLKEGDDDYEPGYTITLEHRLQQGEEANLLKKNETGAYTENLREAIGWREKSDEIKKLEEELQEARNAMYRARKGKTDEERETYNQNRTKAYEAEQSLEDAKEWALTRYTNRTQKDYNLRSDFENFLSDIAWNRRWFRERLYPDEQVKEFIQKYLENPSWHLPQITDFLLIDLIDSDLIRLEEDFHLGLFSSNIANQLGGPNSYFDGSFLVISSNIPTLPTLSPESKRKRS